MRVLSGPVLRDTARLSQRYPPIARYGVFGVSTWPIGCDTPSPFSEPFPLGEHSRSGGAIPPLKRGISAILARYPMKNKAKGCDTPLCDSISKGYCAIWGGISHWAAKCGFEVRLSHTASRRDRQTAERKQHIHHKNCRGGGVEQLKCVHCNKLFATVRARAAHETGCSFCRWCDRMFRSAANRARHERLCLDRPDADVVPE